MEFDVVADGRAWLARIDTVDAESVRFLLLQELAAAAALPLTLALSVFKFDRMEWAIEKAVELGCTRVIPVLAQRTDKHLTQAAGKRAERWRRIALEAAKQSRRTDLPEIADPQRLPTLIAAADSAARRILLAETEQQQTLLHRLRETSGHATAQPREILIAVGPEGGWAPAELTMFEQAGWQSASLGTTILRAETAAIAALAIAAAWHGSELDAASDVSTAREPEADLP